MMTFNCKRLYSLPLFISRVMQSLQIQILLMGTCRQCGSWSVAGHNHRKMIGRDPICASWHDMGFDLSGNGSSETMYDEGDGNLAVG